MANALAAIRRRVKEIQKKHPGKSFRSAQKQAGAEYRAGKVSGAKKKRGSTVKKKRKSVGAVKRRRVGTSVSRPAIRTRSTVGSISSHKAAARRLVKEKLGVTMVNQAMAKKVTAKRKIGKRVAALKKELKALA